MLLDMLVNSFSNIIERAFGKKPLKRPVTAFPYTSQVLFLSRYISPETCTYTIR